MDRRDFIKQGTMAALAGGLPLTGCDSGNGTSKLAAQAASDNQTAAASRNPQEVIAAPTAPGSIRGINDKLNLSAFNGVLTYLISLQLPAGRNNLFYTDPDLVYSNLNGNGPFGLGWQLNLPEIKRKTVTVSKYAGADTFVLTGSDDLIFIGYLENEEARLLNYTVARYTSRTEEAFSRIEYWFFNNEMENNRNFWRIITKENITHIFGCSPGAKWAQPGTPAHVFSWKIELSYDAKGNCASYQYKKDGVDNLYIKQILYANLKPFDRREIATVLQKLADLQNETYNFKVTFDYGDGQGEWKERADPFSFFKAGFEIRTKRICEQIIISHWIDNTYKAVRSLQFSYETDELSKNSMLNAVQLKGYKYTSAAILEEKWPAIQLSYTKFDPALGRFDPFGIGALPDTTQSPQNYVWIDLHGKGLPSLVEDNPETGLWSYWENLGQLNFSNRRDFDSVPAGARLNSNDIRFADFKGNGTADLIMQQAGNWQYYESTADGEWKAPVGFTHAPNADLLAQAVLTDLSGNGTSDALIIGNGQTQYVPCDANGFSDRAIPVNNPSLPELSVTHHAVRIADMTGDGLKDLVRFDTVSGKIEYWPNFGYGAFGDVRQFNLAGSGINPFSQEELPHVFLIDLIGTGCASLVFVDLVSRVLRYWINQSGNSFSKEYNIDIPGDVISNATQIIPIDLAGSGTTGLLFSTNASDAPHWYASFNANKRARLMRSIKYGTGAETRIYYESSTHYLLQNGKKDWFLPFPTQVFSKVEKVDLVQNARYMQTFNYFHGCFDSEEKEFAGFGLVEETDSEAFDLSGGADPMHVPPVRTKQWYSVGKELPEAKQKYYLFQGRRDHIDETTNAGSSAEHRRALKGKLLRKEIYIEDGTPKAATPYQLEEYNYTLLPVTTRDPLVPVVYITLPKETLAFLFERNNQDPRITHSVNAAYDRFGNSLNSVIIAYPRIIESVFVDQNKAYYTLTKNTYTEHIDNVASYLVPHLSNNKTYHIRGQEIARGNILSFAAINEMIATGDKQLLTEKSIRYWNEDITVVYPADHIASHALVYRTYTKVLTGAAVQQLQPHIPITISGNNGYLVKEGGYHLIDQDYWAAAESEVYDPAQFFMPVAKVDARGNKTSVFYDNRKLFVIRTVNPLGIATHATYDPYVMQPASIVDANRNEYRFEFNAFGLLTKTLYVNGSNAELLGSIVYNLTDVPLSVHKTEKIVRDNNQPGSRENYEYLNGLGRLLLKKTRTEYKGAVKWIVGGKKIYNTKGEVVKQEEPFYADSPVYTANEGGEATGMATTFYYDGIGRMVRKVYPDGSFSKQEYTAWDQTISDQNDNDAGSSHFQTPKICHLDVLGRVFLTQEKIDEQSEAKEHIRYHPNSKPAEVFDALNRKNITYEYDLTGETIQSWSLDKGKEYTLRNSHGDLIFQTDERRFSKRQVYDKLNRLVKAFENTGNGEKLIQYSIFGEQVKEGHVNNLNNKKYIELDGGGMLLYGSYDCKGNVLELNRRLLKDASAVIDWTNEANRTIAQLLASTKLEVRNFLTIFNYNLFDQVIAETTPDIKKISYQYNSFGLPVAIKHFANNNETAYINDIDYNARSQPEQIRLGNNCTTTFHYNPLTFRLAGKQTRNQRLVVQDLVYEYDKAGNVLRMRDVSQESIFYNNMRVDHEQTFTYDALYRVVKAEGREKAARPEYDPWSNAVVYRNEVSALVKYAQEYSYDAVGNISKTVHAAGNARTVKQFVYINNTNLLQATNNGNDAPLEKFEYDRRGNARTMHHVKALKWNYDCRLIFSDMEGGGKQYYHYDAQGNRVRKVTRHVNGLVEEVIYLGNYELTRKRQGDTITEDMNCIMINSGKEKIAEIYSRGTETLAYFQLNNPNQSINIELDSRGEIATIEEFDVFGVSSLTIAPEGSRMKRYRFAGKEKDEKTGLYYFGARYYFNAVGRWVSADPLNEKYSGWSSYAYCFNNPVRYTDPDGNEGYEVNELNYGTYYNNEARDSTFVASMIVTTVFEIKHAVLNLAMAFKDADPDMKWNASYNTVNGAQVFDTSIKQVPKEGFLKDTASLALDASTIGFMAGGILGKDKIDASSLLFEKSASKTQVTAAAREVVNGNSKLSQRVTVVYNLFTRSGEYLKTGITSAAKPESRYTRKFMEDKYMVIIGDNPNRLQALQNERKVITISPGPLNKERWLKKNK